MAMYLEELNLRPVRFGNSKDLEQFADILGINIINLKENGNYWELGDGSLYLRLQKKLPEIMLTQYQRWIYEKRRQPSVETLREATNKRYGWRTYHANTGILQDLSKRHRVWQCDIFKNMSKQHCKNSRVVFLLFARRSQSCRMQLGMNLQHRWLFEKAQYNVTQCQPGRWIKAESSMSVQNILIEGEQQQNLW